MADLRSVGFFGNEDEVDLDELRTRLCKISDAELLRDGLAAKSLCEPYFGRPPREVFLIALREARAEWRRRHPKLPTESI